MRYNFKADQIHSIKLEPGEVLIVKLDDPDRDIKQDDLRRLQEYLVNLLETKKIMVYTGCNLEFLKLGLQEHQVDEFLEQELSKK